MESTQEIYIVQAAISQTLWALSTGRYEYVKIWHNRTTGVYHADVTGRTLRDQFTTEASSLVDLIQNVVEYVRYPRRKDEPPAEGEEFRKEMRSRIANLENDPRQWTKRPGDSYNTPTCPEDTPDDDS